MWGNGILSSRGYSAPGASTFALGTNLQAPNYYGTALPFINLVKSAGGNYPYTGWYTSLSGSPGTDTGEEASLIGILDSDGYPTTMPGGVTFTSINTLLCFNTASGIPNASNRYYPGIYRLQYTGKGTVVISGDASLTLTNAGTGTVSNTFTVTTPGQGLRLAITSTDPSSTGDYIRNISVVRNSLASSFDAGAIFNPDYVTALTPFVSHRYMDWLETNNELISLCTTNLLSGVTSCTLDTAWIYATQTRPGYFASGDVFTVTLTKGSSTATWSTGLSRAANRVNFSATLYVSSKDNWAQRSLPSNCFWNLQYNQGYGGGVPYEICIAFANATGAKNAHVNVGLCSPLAYVTGANNLAISGGGGYAALSGSCTWSIENSNEVWNGGFKQTALSGFLGEGTWPGQAGGAAGNNIGWALNYHGMTSALMAQQCQTDWGGSFSRCIPVMGCQAGSTTVLTTKMATSYWVSGPASGYPIKAAAIAPYVGFPNVSTWTCTGTLNGTTSVTGVTGINAAWTVIGCGVTGTNIPASTVVSNYNSGTSTLTLSNAATGSGSITLTMSDIVMYLAQSDGGLTYLFNSFATQFAGSIPTSGYFGQTAGWISSHTALMSSYPGVNLIAYEGGNSLGVSTPAGLVTLMLNAQRDSRYTAIYVTYLEQWKSMVGATIGNIFHQFNDIGANDGTQNGAWGAAESIMQNLTSGSAPPKWQGLLNYIASG